MGNWNYNAGQRSHAEFSYSQYVKEHVNLKARGKNSGITYDLRDSFLDLVKEGKLRDTKADGFSKEDALNLYKELDKIHQERKLSRKYHNMDKGAKFDYSEAEVKRLANAAGYETVKSVKYKDVAVTDHTGVAPKPVAKSVSSKNTKAKTAQAKQEQPKSSFWQRFLNHVSNMKNSPLR